MIKLNKINWQRNLARITLLMGVYFTSAFFEGSKSILDGDFHNLERLLAMELKM